MKYTFIFRTNLFRCISILQISVFIFNKYYTDSFIFILFISFVTFSHVTHIEVQTSQTCVQSKSYTVSSVSHYHAQNTHDEVCQVKERRLELQIPTGTDDADIAR